MSGSPSQRRKAGREAFDPNEDPMAIHPYTEGTWAHKFHLDDWLDGWGEAEREYEAGLLQVPVEAPRSNCHTATCWFCGHEMIWGSDEDFEDRGMEGDGVIAHLSCPYCEATAEFFSKVED